MEETLNPKKDDKSDDSDTGPRTELAYWRRRATQLNSICDDLKQEDLQAVLPTLGAKKSKSDKSGGNAGGGGGTSGKPKLKNFYLKNN
jgi:hypothetical protein